MDNKKNNLPHQIEKLQKLQKQVNDLYKRAVTCSDYTEKDSIMSQCRSLLQKYSEQKEWVKALQHKSFLST